jgi:catechol 2,3-dioxygenase-like lactoylglutathione lyase family enzyme
VLSNHDIVAFVATADAGRARDFYERVLGLHFVEHSPFALVFDANGTVLRIQKVPELKPAPYGAWVERARHSDSYRDSNQPGRSIGAA